MNSSLVRRISLISVLLFATAVHSEQPKMVAIITNALDTSDAPIVTAVSSAARGHASSELHNIEPTDISDPIRKGKLLSRIHRANLVVPIGEGATEFVLREMEDVPVYFIGAGHIEGKYLSSSGISGILPYNLDELLEALSALNAKVLGVAYVPGYEFVTERLKAHAMRHDIRIVEERVSALSNISSAVRGLTAKSDVVWFIGDPLLTRGPGFDFLIERALSRRILVLGTDVWEVRHGAFLCLRSTPEDMGKQAASELTRIIAAGFVLPNPRIEFGPSGGTVFVNASLAKQWNVKIPARSQWKQIP